MRHARGRGVLSGGAHAPERQNVKVIIDDGSTTRGLLSKDREAQVAELMSKHRDELRIPRQYVPMGLIAPHRWFRGAHNLHLPNTRFADRPAWDRQMSASDLQQREKAAFLDWRRALARYAALGLFRERPYAPAS